MKLDEIRPNVETSGNMEENLFSIEDTGMIFDILRNKMYSDPIRAICREISSNARDAHREVGKDNVPCEITLPHSFDPHYRVKDFGPGISPERMLNIFIKYTASTKRNDNTQTGGFGLGAKTPFSYSDTFTIETVHNGIKYNYVCFIDETKVGKLSLMSQQFTDAPNGTEIIIPVKRYDFPKFSDDTEYVTRHWTVRPTINGGSFTYKDISPSLRGENYSICKSNDYHNAIRLIVDGIEYPLDTSKLNKSSSLKVLNAVNGLVYLYFNVGELSLSATREAIHLNDATQAKINSKLDEITRDLAADVSKQIDAQPTLWAAQVWVNTHLSKSFNNLDFLGFLYWRNQKLIIGRKSILSASVFVFTKGKKSRHGYNPNKIIRNASSNIDFIENAAIYLCDLDLKEPQVKNVIKAYEDDSNLKYVYVVKPTEKVLTTDKEISIEDVDKLNGLTALGAKNISTITKASKNYSISGVRLLVFKFVPSACAFKQVSYAAMEEDKNEKIICSLNRDNYDRSRRISLKNNKELQSGVIKSLLDLHSEYSIYGIDNAIPASKVEEHFSDFESIDDFIDEKVLNNDKIDIVGIKYATKNQWNITRSIQILEPFQDKILKKDSSIFQYLSVAKNIHKTAETHSGILKIYESIHGSVSEKELAKYLKDNPKLDMDALKAATITRYPLISHVDYYASDKIIEPIIHYINLIDKENEVKGLV